MTQYSVSIDPDALADIEKAINRYGNFSRTLSDKFQTQVTKGILSLRVNPQLHAIRQGAVRLMPVKGFPYRVLFLIKETTRKVRILDVLHESQNPKDWPAPNPPLPVSLSIPF